ncbi:hypothetical protein RF11_11413 [Thelohanellus kitauei]|uniref:Uncharacterized protein n=1 Tax=Thelohanellus kitauei TaxID=669202 RepID=A0A0C2MS23_THEKT|nr:hypothetical protein RF11_11413 [Thelohanellus kitauei]
MRLPWAYCCHYLGHELPWAELDPYPACTNEASKAFNRGCLPGDNRREATGQISCCMHEIPEYICEVHVTQYVHDWQWRRRERKVTESPEERHADFCGRETLCYAKETPPLVQFGYQLAKEESLQVPLRKVTISSNGFSSSFNLVIPDCMDPLRHTSKIPFLASTYSF